MPTQFSTYLLKPLFLFILFAFIHPNSFAQEPELNLDQPIPNMNWMEWHVRVNMLLQEAKFEEANDLSIQALKIAKERDGQQHENYIGAMKLRGFMLQNMRDYEGAMNIFLEANELAETHLAPKTPLIGYLLSSIGALYSEANDNANAIQYMIKAAEHAKLSLGEDHIEYALQISNIASCYNVLGDYDKALPYFHQSLAIAEKAVGKETYDYGTYLMRLAGAYRNKGAFQKAIVHYKEALDLAEAGLGKEHPWYGNCLSQLGTGYEFAHKFHDAKYYYELAIEHAENVAPVHPIRYLALQKYLAGIYAGLGQYDKAVKIFEYTLELARDTLAADDYDMPLFVGDLAEGYRQSGQYEKALPLYLEALDLTKKLHGEEHPEYGTRLKFLGRFYCEIGQSEKALPMLKKSLVIKEAYLGKEDLKYANGLIELGRAYKDINELEESLVMYKEALGIIERIAGIEYPVYGVTLDRIGSLYKNMGKHEIAKTYLFKSLKLAEKLDGVEHPEYATSLNNLGSNYGQMGQMDSALICFQMAVEIVDKKFGDNHPTFGDYLTNAAKASWRVGDIKLATAYYDRIINNIRIQIENFYPKISENERIKYWSKLEQSLHEIKYFCTEESLLTSELQNLNLLVKGLALEGSIEVRHKILEGQRAEKTIVEAFNEWNSTKNILAHNYTHLASNSPNLLDSLQAQADLQEGKVSRLISTKQVDYSQKISQKTKENILIKQLKSNDAAIDFLTYRAYDWEKSVDTIWYAALVNLPKQETPHLVKLCTEEQLKRIFSAAVSIENNRNYITNSRNNQKLFELIWQPLLPYLKNIKSVHLSPTGLLHQVAFDALKMKKDETIILDKYDIYYYSNLRDIVTEKRERRTNNSDHEIALIGGAIYSMDSLSLVKMQETPEFVSSFSNQEDEFDLAPEDLLALRSLSQDTTRTSIRFDYLAGTKEEVEAIHQQFTEKNQESQLFVGAKALEEQVKALSGSNAPEILHIATHGYFFQPFPKSKNTNKTFRENILTSDNPMVRSGLVFTGVNQVWEGGQNIEGLEDGLLTAYEIANLNLFSTQLAVLSACETGRGDVHDAEGVFGLQRAFKTAGVDQLILSLWKVPDRETAEMMNYFYEYYLEGRSIENAFRKAQKKMRATYDPYYWAAWVLVE